MKRNFSLLIFGILFLLGAAVFQAVRERVSVSAPDSDLAAVGATAKKSDCALQSKPREFNAAPTMRGL